MSLQDSLAANACIEDLAGAQATSLLPKLDRTFDREAFLRSFIEDKLPGKHSRKAYEAFLDRVNKKIERQASEVLNDPPEMAAEPSDNVARRIW